MTPANNEECGYPSRGDVMVKKIVREDYSRHRFSPLFLILILAGIALIGITVGLLTETADPGMIRSLTEGYPPSWTGVIAAVTIVALLIIPMCWVIVNDTLDLVTFFLAWESMIMCGYFFLKITAWKLNGSLGQGILGAAPLIVLINAAGFAVLLSVMGVTYALLYRFRIGVEKTLEAPDADKRLKWLLRAVGLFTIVILIMPMCLTGIVPAFVSNPTLGEIDPRLMVTESSPLRALYNLGYGLMPFVTAGLILLCIRKPLRFLGVDGMIIAALMLAQFLSGNRFPLALAGIAALCLVSMEWRIPRFFLVAAFALYMLLFTALGGLTGLLRWDRAQLSEGNPIVNCIQESFMGNNLIDIRDASWVMSQWDYKPMNGTTYMGGLTAFLPSGLFPQKKQWHLGLTAVRIVGWDDSTHPGLRITFFGESFMNFGLAGVITLGIILGILFGTLLRTFHQAAGDRPSSLNRNLRILILMEMALHLSNTSNAFSFWVLATFLLIQWLFVDLIPPVAYASDRS